MANSIDSPVNRAIGIDLIWPNISFAEQIAVKYHRKWICGIQLLEKFMLNSWKFDVAKMSTFLFGKYLLFVKKKLLIFFVHWLPLSQRKSIPTALLMIFIEPVVTYMHFILQFNDILLFVSSESQYCSTKLN